MSEYLVNLSRRFIPAVGSIIVFFCIHVIQKIGGFMLPFWCVVVLSILWVVLLLGYLLQFNIFNNLEISNPGICFLPVSIKEIHFVNSGDNNIISQSDTVAGQNIILKG